MQTHNIQQSTARSRWRYRALCPQRFTIVNSILFILSFRFVRFSTADICAFLVVFVLPLNSAVNPILYTFTTPKYRNQVLLRGWNKLTSRKITRNDGSGHTHTGSGSNHGMNLFVSRMKSLIDCFNKYALLLHFTVTARSQNSNLSRSRRMLPDEDRLA